MDTGISRLDLEAPAKINLYLEVTGRRSDGYHELASLIQKIGLADRLRFEKIDIPKIELHCPNSSLAEDDGNLVFQAASRFCRFYQGRNSDNTCGVRITLEKNIPIAAGLGGGSSDAATTLLGLNQLFNANIPKRELFEIATAIGADVPLFLYKESAVWVTGIGEVITPAPSLTNFRILLVNPGFDVSTRWVYENFELTTREKKFNFSCFSQPDLPEFRKSNLVDEYIASGTLVNDLERVTVSRYPIIDEIKQQMLQSGAEAALMSGSGPTVFGLFLEQESEAAEDCCAVFRNRWPATYLLSPWS